MPKKTKLVPHTPKLGDRYRYSKSKRILDPKGPYTVVGFDDRPGLGYLRSNFTVGAHDATSLGGFYKEIEVPALTLGDLEPGTRLSRVTADPSFKFCIDPDGEYLVVQQVPYLDKYYYFVDLDNNQLCVARPDREVQQ